MGRNSNCPTGIPLGDSAYFRDAYLAQVNVYSGKLRLLAYDSMHVQEYAICIRPPPRYHFEAKYRYMAYHLTVYMTLSEGGRHIIR